MPRFKGGYAGLRGLWAAIKTPAGPVTSVPPEDSGSAWTAGQPRPTPASDGGLWRRRRRGRRLECGRPRRRHVAAAVSDDTASVRPDRDRWKRPKPLLGVLPEFAACADLISHECWGDDVLSAQMNMLYPSPADLRSATAECARSSTLMRASAAEKACSACPSAGITTLLSSVEPAGAPSISSAVPA